MSEPIISLSNFQNRFCELNPSGNSIFDVRKLKYNKIKLFAQPVRDSLNPDTFLCHLPASDYMSFAILLLMLISLGLDLCPYAS